MPCTVTGTLEGDHILSLQEAAKRNETIIAELMQLLCEANTELDRIDGGHHVVIRSGPLREWWKLHKRTDKKKRRRK